MKALREISDKAVELAGKIAGWMNGGDGVQLAHAMHYEHRTLQQNFTKMCVAWLEHLASLEPGEYDGRNEASVELAGEFMKIPVDKRSLPLI